MPHRHAEQAPNVIRSKNPRDVLGKAVALIETPIVQLLAKGGKPTLNDVAHAEDQWHEAGAYLHTQ